MQISNLGSVIGYFAAAENRVTAVHVGQTREAEQFRRSADGAENIVVYPVETPEESSGSTARTDKKMPPSKISDVWQTVQELATVFYTAPYRGAVARAKRDEDDLFMLFIFSEMMGVPNPATYYTLELQPILMEQFHEWHTRMGMEHSPLDHFKCC
jgi:hypothetical protein